MMSELRLKGEFFSKKILENKKGKGKTPRKCVGNRELLDRPII